MLKRPKDKKEQNKELEPLEEHLEKVIKQSSHILQLK